MSRRVAFADPPYLGCAHLYPEKAEVDHESLIKRLEHEFDAWALSCSSPSLRHLLPMTPPDTRVMAWVKPFCSFKPGQRVAYAWEPVLVRGVRKGTREEPTVRDWLAANITLQKGLAGAKPEEFAYWLFEVLMEPCDELVDLFPGTGAVTEAWHRWRSERALGRDVERAAPLPGQLSLLGEP